MIVVVVLKMVGPQGDWVMEGAVMRAGFSIYYFWGNSVATKSESRGGIRQSEANIQERRGGADRIEVKEKMAEQKKSVSGGV